MLAVFPPALVLLSLLLADLSQARNRLSLRSSTHFPRSLPSHRRRLARRSTVISWDSPDDAQEPPFWIQSRSADAQLGPSDSDQDVVARSLNEAEMIWEEFVKRASSADAGADAAATLAEDEDEDCSDDQDGSSDSSVRPDESPSDAPGTVSSSQHSSKAPSGSGHDEGKNTADQSKKQAGAPVASQARKQQSDASDSQNKKVAQKPGSDEAAKQQAAQDAKEEEARKKQAADQEARKKQAADEEARKKQAADEEARKKQAADEEARKKQAADDEARRKQADRDAAAPKPQQGPNLSVKPIAPAAASGGQSHHKADDDAQDGSPSHPSGDSHTGDATFYDVGLGSCGITDANDNMIVAISKLLYDTFPAQAGNPNTSGACGKKIRATYDGKSVDVVVHDRCEGCQLTDLDFSPTAFERLGSKDQGRLHGMTWTFV